MTATISPQLAADTKTKNIAILAATILVYVPGGPQAGTSTDICIVSLADRAGLTIDEVRELATSKSLAKMVSAARTSCLKAKSKTNKGAVRVVGPAVAPSPGTGPYTVQFRDPGMHQTELVGLTEEEVKIALKKYRKSYAEAWILIDGAIVQLFEHELGDADWYAHRSEGALSNLATTLKVPQKFY